MLNSPATKSLEDVPVPVSGQASLGANTVVWKIQAYGLVGITFLSFFPRLFHYQEYFFFALLTLSLYVASVEKVALWCRSPIDLPLLGFVGWVLWTVPFAVDPAYSFAEWRKLVVQVLVFYWAMFVLRGDTRTETSRRILLAVVLGSLVLSGFALMNFAWRGGTWRDRLVRAGAPYSDYNWLTTYLVLVIPVIIAWVFIHRSYWARALGLLTLLATASAQIAAYTRAGWVAHLVQAVGLGILAGRQRLVIWVLVGAITMGGGLLAVSKMEYQRDTIDPWTMSARVKTWQLGLHQVVEHPLVGVGYGDYTFLKMHAAEVEAEKGKGAVEKVLPGLHNTFAMVLMGSGVPALSFLVWILFRAMWELAAGMRQARFQQTSMLMLAPFIALAVVGFFVRNAFDYMFAGSLASLFWILVAVGFSIKDNQSNSLGPAISGSEN
jgi:putative inorganic carbon (hco3(-)) transporter